MNDKKKILNAIIERNKLQDFVRDNLDLIHQMMLARLGKPYSKMGVQNDKKLTEADIEAREENRPYCLWFRFTESNLKKGAWNARKKGDDVERTLFAQFGEFELDFGIEAKSKPVLIAFVEALTFLAERNENLASFETLVKITEEDKSQDSEEGIRCQIVRGHQNINRIYEHIEKEKLSELLENAGTGRKTGTLYFRFTAPEYRWDCVTIFHRQIYGAFAKFESDGSFSLVRTENIKDFDALTEFGKAVVDSVSENLDLPKLMCYVVGQD